VSGPSNWRLYIQRSGFLDKIKVPGTYHRAILQKATQDDPLIRLIDIRSKTFVMISNILSPLESPQHIITTKTSHSLEVWLPRLRLSFFANTNGELECRSIPGYVIDSTQSCGTIFGLRNKLVFCPRPSSPEKPPLPRRVIIPQGKVSFKKDGNFANIRITTEAVPHVRWHEYTIDTDLRCLRSNSSLNSKLYQCYLHALTSHCLPDPLLGHTGTEEALYILRNATCRSFQRLDVQEAKLLELISDLSTFRVYSQQATAIVQWKDLPALSQHHGFFQAVHPLVRHADSLEALYDQPVRFNTSECDQTMFNRVASRNKLYYPSDLDLSKQSSLPGDVNYISRDVSDAQDDIYDCRRRIGIYMQMIPPEIPLHDHMLRLRSFPWQRYHREVSTPSTPSVPYAFTPQFIATNIKAPSYSLSDILVSHTSVPTPSPDGQQFQDYARLPPIATTERILPPPTASGSGRLETLINELLNSRQPSLQLYGNELNKSYRELLDKNDSQFSQGAVPSHELLLNYHEQCSRRKDKFFSEILAALAPSQSAEETSRIAGLWPRITPRSLLHQLTQDRISTLPDQWKMVITHYAVSFLKYQQSLRMLELSSRHKTEELRWEIEGMSHDVLAESTPDWLLIQVHPLLCWRKQTGLTTMSRSKRIL
jgi:hypothetical protein